jgi:hypothetical protein
VPYFDFRCGARFANVENFQAAFSLFWENVRAGAYRPREFVTQHFDLGRQAQAYLDLCAAVRSLA